MSKQILVIHQSMQDNSSVRRFYEDEGWSSPDGCDEPDASLFEDLRIHSKKYLSQNRLKLNHYFPTIGNDLLDCASGPIQYEEYKTYSEHYKKRHCVDLSSIALDKAMSKLPSKVIPYCGDIRDIDFQEQRFDTILSLHTIYHLPLSDQVPTVSKLLDSLNPGGVMIILYSNPCFLLEKIKNLLSFLIYRKSKETKFLFERLTPDQVMRSFPSASLIPYRFLSGEDMKRLLPNNFVSAFILEFISLIEAKLPLFLCQYYIIKLSK